MKIPLFSIVTVVLNERDKLLRTITSIREQTFDDYEYIVIDGESYDGTLDLLQEYAGSIDHWISEPDKGLYDAMNKGIALARGQWVIFMNAGDRFYDSKVLENVWGCGLDDVTYGGSIYINNSRPRKYFSVPDVWKGMFASHQSVFIKRDLLEKHSFDTTYSIAADYESLVYFYTSGAKIKKVPLMVSALDPLGVSRTQRIASYRERLNIACKYSSALDVPLWRIKSYYWSLIVQEYIKAPIRPVLGQGA